MRPMYLGIDEEIKWAIGLATTDLQLISKFVEDTNGYITQMNTTLFDDLFKGKSSAFIKDFMDYYLEAMSSFSDMMHEAEAVIKGQKEPIVQKEPIKSELSRKYPEEMNDLMVPALLTSMKPLRYPEFLFNMALIYIITRFEAFLSDFLFAIYSYNVDALKSDKEVMWKEALSFDDMNDLVNHLSRLKVKDIMSENIDSIAKMLLGQFDVDLNKFDRFHVIREASYRRNTVVHNESRADQKYCERISGTELGIKLKTDLEYIDTLLTSIGHFIDYIDDQFSHKFKYQRDEKSNSLLHPSI
ncbi:hypothetical protein ACFLVR_04270 [Chloroflexota bacterium]